MVEGSNPSSCKNFQKIKKKDSAKISKNLGLCRNFNEIRTLSKLQKYDKKFQKKFEVNIECSEKVPPKLLL